MRRVAPLGKRLLSRAAFTGRAVSNNIGNSEACCEPTPRAQSLLEGALTGNNAVNIGMHNPEERARGGPRYAKHLTKALWCGRPGRTVQAGRPHHKKH